VSAFLASVTAASAIVYARTTVSIVAKGRDLSGFVSSSNRRRCANNRVVTVFRQRGSRQNPRVDTRIASDNASLNGNRYMWSTGNTGMTGRLYARAGRIRGCRADSSRTIRVQ
jgi:hypothetical protein